MRVGVSSVLSAVIRVVMTSVPSAVMLIVMPSVVAALMRIAMPSVVSVPMGVAGGIVFPRIEAQTFVLDLEEVDQLGHVLVRQLQVRHPDLVESLIELDRGRIPGIDHFTRVGEPLLQPGLLPSERHPG